MTAAAFKATYSDFRLIKGRKVVQFVFELPIEQADVALKVVGGMPNPAAEVWCGIARLDTTKINEGDAPVPAPLTAEITTSASATRRGESSPVNRLAQRAGILCNDPLFHRYLERRLSDDVKGPTVNTEFAAGYVRKFCKVKSRADIKPNTEASTRLDLLESAFTCWRDQPELADAS